MSNRKSIKEVYGVKFFVLFLLPFYFCAFILVTIALGQMVKGSESYHKGILNYAEEIIENEIDFIEQSLVRNYEMYVDNEQYFQQLIRDKPTFDLENEIFDEIAIVHKSGETILSIDDEDGRRDYTKNESFLYGTSRKVYWSKGIVDESTGNTFYYLSYREDSEFIIVAKYSFGALNNVVEEISKDHRTIGAILSLDGEFLVSKENYHFSDTLDGNDLKSIEMSTKKMRTMYMDDSLMIVTIKRVRNRDMVVVSYTYFVKYFYPVIMMSVCGGFTIVALTFFVIRYMHYHSGEMIAAIEEVTQLTGAVTRGNYGYEIEHTEYEELNTLIDYFNQMSTTIQNNFVRLYQNNQTLEALNNNLSQQNLKVRENESQIERIIENTYEGVMLIDMECRVLRINKKMITLLGLKVEDTSNFVCCTDYFKHLPKESRGYDASFLSLIKTKSQKVIEIQGKLIEEIVIPLYDNNIRIGYIRTYKDVTASKEFERKVNQATKIEAVGRLTSGIVHDFNNILQIILGYVELIPLELNQSNDHHHNIEKKVQGIVGAANKGGRLVEQLMTFSKMDQGEKAEINLNECIVDVARMLESVIRKPIDFEVVLDDDIERIYADVTQIEQIILNLCLNAKDAIIKEGKIKVKSKSILIEGGYFPCLEISDNGHGMPKNVQERIFDPFYTTKEPGKGTGLGLSTVIGIVESHGATIDVVSHEGKGTKFTIVFPNKKLRSITLNNLNQVKSLKANDKKTVMLIERNEKRRDEQERILKKMGYHVLTAVDGFDALDRYDDQFESIDIVIIDTTVEGVSARRVYEFIIELNPTVRVLMTSSFENGFLEHLSELDHRLYYIRKPYSNESLMDAVEYMMQV